MHNILLLFFPFSYCANSSERSLEAEESFLFFFCKFMIMRRYKITEDCIKLRHQPFLVVLCKKEDWRSKFFFPSSSTTISSFFMLLLHTKIFFFLHPRPCNAQNVVNKEFFPSSFTSCNYNIISLLKYAARDWNEKITRRLPTGFAVIEFFVFMGWVEDL